MNLNKLLIVANWKCNPVRQKEAQELFDSIKNGVGETINTEIVICPPFVYLVNLRLTTNNLRLGGQNCFWEQSGPYTGEISAQMLKNLGCEYVILGHSERRQHLGETNETINKKLKTALEVGLKPIFCVGDKNRKSKNDIEEIRIQLEKGLAGIQKSELRNILFVYEPVWAISTTENGITAGSNDALEGKLFIEKVLSEMLAEIVSPQVPILYGGSVDSNNAKDYINAGFDGLLIGGASLNIEEFIKILKIIDEIR